MHVVYVVGWRVKEGREEEAKQLVKANFEHIEQEKRGNVLFATHQSKDDARRFWMYEIWQSQEAVDDHESSSWFKEKYKAKLKPIVENDSIIFDNLALVDVRGLFG
jgi:quinol monooxygenase YgiN